MPTRKEEPLKKSKVGKELEVQEVKTSEPNTISVIDGATTISYSITITKNLGDYESLKIQAGLTIPLGASDELLNELDKLMVVAKDRIVSRLSIDIIEITKTIN